MTDWHTLPIAGLHDAFRAGRLDASGLVGHYLARIDRFDGELRSFIEVDRAGALEAARDSDARIASGDLRPLEGVPVAVKANIAVKGLSWNAGMALRRDMIAEEDAAVVARLRAAGAIILGTLNMHEAALGATTDNPWYGRALNPHDRARTPGGSSGGSGVAVAAGLCQVALGTDTMGSVRIPAAYNGVYGLKPTNGAVPDEGLVPLSLELDSIGPLCRSMADITVAGAVLHGAGTDAGLKPGRLVLLADMARRGCSPAVMAAYDRARAAPALAGLTPEYLALSRDAGEIRFAGFIVVANELIGHLGSDVADKAELLSEELRFMLDYAVRKGPAEHEKALAVLADTRAEIRAALGSDGLLLMPTTPQAAFLHDPRPPVNQPDFTGLANIGGLPAISIPAGLDGERMPIAVQLVGPAGSDAVVTAVATELDLDLGGYVPPVVE